MFFPMVLFFFLVLPKSSQLAVFLCSQKLTWKHSNDAWLCLSWGAYPAWNLVYFFYILHKRLFFLYFTHKIALFCALVIDDFAGWFSYLLFCFMKPSWFLHCLFTLFHMYLWLCILTDLWWIFQYCRTCLSIFNTKGGFGGILQKSLKIDLWVCVRPLMRKVGFFCLIFGSLQVWLLWKTAYIFAKHLVYTE